MFNPFKKKPFEIDDFAKLVMAEAKKAGIAESLEYDPKSLVLKRGDQRTNLVNLLNDYSQANAEQRGGGTADSSTITFPGLPIWFGFGFLRSNLFLSPS
jgi:hypothetical protein